MDHHFVDIWQADLIQDAAILSKFRDVLDEQEKYKADTYKLPLMRDRYVAVRGISRLVLAGYLKADPATLKFTVGEYGKPALICNTLHFNISHTDNLLLVAVANFPEIGIDIEVIKPRNNLDGLARRCFTASEFQVWRQLSLSQSLDTFYRLWTKKEAFVKAIGRGIALGLEQCEVETDKGGQLRMIPAAYGAASDWKITEITVSTNACAALVTPYCEFRLQHKQFAYDSGINA